MATKKLEKPKLPKMKSNIGFDYQDDKERPRAKPKGSRGHGKSGAGTPTKKKKKRTSFSWTDSDMQKHKVKKPSSKAKMLAAARKKSTASGPVMVAKSNAKSSRGNARDLLKLTGNGAARRAGEAILAHKRRLANAG